MKKQEKNYWKLSYNATVNVRNQNVPRWLHLTTWELMKHKQSQKVFHRRLSNTNDLFEYDEDCRGHHFYFIVPTTGIIQQKTFPKLLFILRQGLIA